MFIQIKSGLEFELASYCSETWQIRKVKNENIFDPTNEPEQKQHKNATRRHTFV